MIMYETEEERLKARRAAARRWKKRNKHRRTQDGYLDAKQPRKAKVTAEKIRAKRQKKLSRTAKVDQWFDQLRKKHAGKPRLTESVKPPIPLIIPE